MSVGSSSPTGRGSTTGAAIVAGGSSWRNLSVRVPAEAIVEDGFPMLGRYTCANAVINGESVLGSWVGARRLSPRLSLFLSASRMVLPQDPSTDSPRWRRHVVDGHVRCALVILEGRAGQSLVMLEDPL